MNSRILHKEVQDFINHHLQSDISKVLYKGSPFADVTIRELVEQIEAKKKTKDKLPTWFNTKNIYYPNKLNIEQTSSEISANYKSSLVSGDSLIDLTGGFGIDTYQFSKRFKEVVHCEINEDLSMMVSHNLAQLHCKNVKTVASDGLTFIASQQKFDWIYVDPSRRNESKGKVFMLEDCIPNVPKNLELLFRHSNDILLKVSPMLDITQAVNELSFVKDIHVVAIHNEVKEVLFILKKEYRDTISLKTVNITASKQDHFEAYFKQPKEIEFSLPKAYLYEPNAAILKAGLFDDLSTLGVSKLHKNSHLYTSETLIDFPGRSFKIEHIINYDRKQLKKLIPSQKGNITTRNFPDTVAQIRKRTKLKEGGHHYLFFTTNIENSLIVILCQKVL